MVPPFDTEVSSNGQAATTVAEPQQQPSLETRSVRSQVIEAIDPLQKQLDAKLHELDESLRPRLSKPVQEKPLLAVAVSAGVGVLVGALTVFTLIAGAHARAGSTTD
jgi:ElaB/YqjD/DUF883 family membrane-anchored ribosome-binding protein